MIPALGKLKEKDPEFETSLGYMQGLVSKLASKQVGRQAGQLSSKQTKQQGS